MGATCVTAGEDQTGCLPDVHLALLLAEGGLRAAQDGEQYRYSTCVFTENARFFIMRSIKSNSGIVVLWLNCQPFIMLPGFFVASQLSTFSWISTA